MKTIYLLISFLVFSVPNYAQKAVMPAHTIAAIRTIEKSYQHERNTPSQPALNFYRIYMEKAQYRIAVLANVNFSFSKADAIRDGYDVGPIVGTEASMRMPLHLLCE